MSVPDVTKTKTKTMFEIEREARWRVWALFALLLFMVYLCIWVLVMAAEAVVEVFSQASGVDRHFLVFSLSPRGVGLILVFSAAVAVFYWFVSRIGARDHLTRAMHAQPLDPDDRFHQRLADIVEEMRIATGGPAVRCLTVSTVGMNAFAFSDLHGSACIGVTEGALSRLSRQQLEAVVAHEFGHVLSGDYVTATSACLLFGVYTSLGDTLDDAMVAGVGAPALLLIGAVCFRGLLGLLQLGSAVTNAAISRQRESLADLAAARYTRDPLSLAQALQMMVRHAGGSGYIPDGLSALCIRPTDLNPRSAVQRAMATHPPVNDRIVRLLNSAHVGWDQFQQQAAVAEQVFEEREHISQAPGVSAAAVGAAALSTGIVAVAPAVAVAAAAPAAVTAAPPPLDTAPPTTTALAPPPPATVSPAIMPPMAIPTAATNLPRVPSAAMPPAAADSLRSHDAHELALACPACGVPLESYDYEGATVFVCRSCAGRLATTAQVQRILTRREMRFDERQERLADYVVAHGDELRRDFARRRGTSQTTHVACPRCGRTMMRRHYNYDYAIEVDYCGVCDLFWFDRDELEALQVIMERITQ
jgi:Zn-dependent protease with chaperone function/Zn-finger nucleic acid-binding protein